MDKLKVFEDYKNDDNLRSKFNDFVQIVFPGADFETWYQKGFWSGDYVPFSIIIDNKIVSNVSITKMKVLIENKELRGIQFGTVGTLPEYRKRGLSRYLMEHVIERIENSADFLFLFANEDVLDFYPKFGFDRYSEVIFKSESGIPKSKYSARKLDIKSGTDFAIIKRLISQRLVLSRFFGATDYGFITFWHILNIFPGNLYYIEEDDSILIISKINYCLHIYDAIYSKPIDIKSAISKVIEGDEIRAIRYYFSPDQLHFEYDSIEEDLDSPLFVRGSFPIGNRNFKFPITAQT